MMSMLSFSNFCSRQAQSTSSARGAGGRQLASRLHGFITQSSIHSLCSQRRCFPEGGRFRERRGSPSCCRNSLAADENYSGNVRAECRRRRAHHKKYCRIGQRPGPGQRRDTAALRSWAGLGVCAADGLLRLIQRQAHPRCSRRRLACTHSNVQVRGDGE